MDALGKGTPKNIVSNLGHHIPGADCHSIILDTKLTCDVARNALRDVTPSSTNIDTHGGGGTHNPHVRGIVDNLWIFAAPIYEPGYSPVGSVDEHPLLEAVH